MVSAHAPAKQSNHTKASCPIKRMVTRSRIQAHSSNQGSFYPRDEGTTDGTHRKPNRGPNNDAEFADCGGDRARRVRASEGARSGWKPPGKGGRRGSPAAGERW